MQALDIISAEHRGMWRLASALDGLRSGLQARPLPVHPTKPLP